MVENGGTGGDDALLTSSPAAPPPPEQSGEPPRAASAGLETSGGTPPPKTAPVPPPALPPPPEGYSKGGSQAAPNAEGPQTPAPIFRAGDRVTYGGGKTGVVKYDSYSGEEVAIRADDSRSVGGVPIARVDYAGPADQVKKLESPDLPPSKEGGAAPHAESAAVPASEGTTQPAAGASPPRPCLLASD